MGIFDFFKTNPKKVATFSLKDSEFWDMNDEDFIQMFLTHSKVNLYIHDAWLARLPFKKRFALLSIRHGAYYGFNRIRLIGDNIIGLKSELYVEPEFDYLHDRLKFLRLKGITDEKQLLNNL